MGGRKGRGRITKGKWRGGEREGGRERVGEGSEGRLNNILPPGAWDEVAPLAGLLVSSSVCDARVPAGT